MAAEAKPRTHWETNWDALMQVHSTGAQFGSISTGEGTNSTTVLRAVFPPHCTVSPHSHDIDYLEISLEGAQKVGRKGHRQGDIRVVNKGTVYGPLVAGPDGATVLIVMNGTNVEARVPKHGAPLTLTINPPPAK